MRISNGLGLGLIISLSVLGCQSSLEAKEDVREKSIDASNRLKQSIDNGANVAKNVKSEAKNAGENIGAATGLTPRIKNAINADPKLNSDQNLIDVDSTKDKVSLSGHVASEELKALAGTIAKSEMQKAKAQQKLVNNLVVQAATKP